MNKNRVKILMVAAALMVGGGVQAGGFYIEGGVSALRSRDPLPPREYYVATPMVYADGSTRYSFEWQEFPNRRPSDINEVRNPYGSLSIGYSIDFGKFDWDLNLRHRSSFSASDAGEDSVNLALRWYPFGRR